MGSEALAKCYNVHGGFFVGGELRSWWTTTGTHWVFCGDPSLGFPAGENFVLEMQKAATGTHKTIAVLSDNYLSAEYTHPEWAAAFARDPQGHERTLIPMRVQECTPRGLLGPIQYVDLRRSL